LLRILVAISRSSWVCARFDRFEVDLRSGELRTADGVPVRIQQKPLQVLRLLLESEGNVVTRDQLRGALWPVETFVDFELGVNTAVKKLRQALEDSAETPKFVETLPKIGYRLIAPVEWVSRAQDKLSMQTELPINAAVPVPLSSPPHRYRNLRLATALVALIVLTATGFFGRNALGVLLHRFGIWKYSSPATSVAERRLTANPDDTPVTNGVISPDGKYLAYTDATGFYLRQVDGGETHSVSLPKGFDAVVESWFPDSVHLVVSWAENPQRAPGLWKTSFLGGPARRLTEEGFSGSVSPDASQIVFFKHPSAEEEIWIMRADGDRPRKLISSEKDSFSRVAWAPDGKRFAYARTKTRYYTSGSAPDTQIEVFDLRNNQITVVRSIGDRGLPRGGAALGWLPDGRLIYPLREARPNQQDTNLWSVQLDPDTSQPLGGARRITNGRGIAVQLSLTADGQRMALRRHAPQPDIFVADLEPGGTGISKLRRLTFDDRIDYAMAWTADSRFVLFYSNRDGPFHVFKQDLNATQPELLVGGEDDLYVPRLSPDGKSVLYVVRSKPGGPSNKAAVMRVPVDGGVPQFVLDDSGIWDIECPRLPSTVCVYSRIEAGHQMFFSFDPVKGRIGGLQAGKLIGDNFDWCLSHDGKYIAYARNRSALKQFGLRIVSLEDGSQRDISVAGWVEIYGLDWAADNKSLWATAYDTKGNRSLLRVPPRGSAKTLLSYHNVDLEWAIPSPDGRHLAVVKESNTSNVWLLQYF
jgi:Tol biopolymer transport system component/DNA-binding winged helix-turn-helix (wHTH) protein